MAQNARAKYEALEDGFKDPGKLKQYIPFLDTLKTSMKFLEGNPELTKNISEAGEKIKGSLGQLSELEGKLQQAEQVKAFLKERKAYLMEELSRFGMVKELRSVSKEVYYYSQQINEYKEVLKDQRKLERKALELISKTKVFQDFMRRNSQLASLFRIPGSVNTPSNPVASLAGLQTRTQVNQMIIQQLGSGGPNAMAQVQGNIQDAQSQLNDMKARLAEFTGINPSFSGDAEEIPDFKPNNQKTKSFKQRLEYGTNFQSQRASYMFPVTSDIGLSVGYKLNDKSIVGIGASYKVGWGQDWQHLAISHEGVGLRSFVDWKIKGSFFLAGGYEMNYRSEFNRLEQLEDLNAWQQSGLIGLSKVVSLRSKLFKKTKIQLLFDFLSYQQVPRTQPLLFRVGYNF